MILSSFSTTLNPFHIEDRKGHKDSKKLGNIMSPSLFLVSKYICIKHGISQLVSVSAQLTNQLIGKSQGS